MECPICCEKYTSKLRRKITCSKCQDHSCINCVVKYFETNILNPRCMFCQTETSLQDTKPFLPSVKFKRLFTLEINALFDKEVLLIVNSERTFNDFVRAQRMIIMREILEEEGVDETLIDSILEGFGYGRETQREDEKKIHFCTSCEIPISDFKCFICNTEYCKKCQCTHF